jgi:sulfatase maturation enzyme AslB (radical SAM superfamily)
MGSREFGLHWSNAQITKLWCNLGCAFCFLNMGKNFAPIN